jgi:uncharacterized protein YcnI
MKNLAALLLLGLPVAAVSHVVLAPDTSPAGAYYAGVLRVGHGCDGATTTEVHVTIPVAAKDAKPQPKPGWTVIVERDGGRVTGLRWTGSMPAEQFDSFGIMLVLDPAVTGIVYLPVVQRCGETEKRWTQIPESGAAWTSVPSPAPRLIVSPAMPEQHSNH